MKVLFTNNYPMDRAWELWNKGENPGHHLWGITHLSKYGINVDILPYEKYAILNRIGHWLGLRNYVDQQLRILFKQNQFDIVYSASGDNTLLLSLLRVLGIFRKPIVVAMHHPLRNTLKNRLSIKGYDKILCLSNRIKEYFKDRFDGCEEQLEVLEWAFDLPFYDQNRVKNDSSIKDESGFILSAGHTRRDYNTLAKAFSEINYPLRIYCSEKTALNIPKLPTNVEVHYGKVLGRHALSYRDLIQEYEEAYAVAIPLDIPSDKADSITLVGVTSLLEAMTMGKAVVMNENKQIGIDIEKEGIGIWAEQGDVQSWQRAISYLLAHPQETKKMGNRGRCLCENKYNLELFSSRLARSLKDVLSE